MVIGIGGSYLGARGVIELPALAQLQPEEEGHAQHLLRGQRPLRRLPCSEIVELLGDEDFSVNVISKSGTTTEPAVAFRFFRELLEKKYGKDGGR